MGVFEYLRVPMGIKGSAAYFQQVMATVVLVGLIHIICKCYQDDILTFGSTTVEFINNLREVFLRLRKHELTVNIKKCQFVSNKLNMLDIQFLEKEFLFLKINVKKFSTL